MNIGADQEVNVFKTVMSAHLCTDSSSSDTSESAAYQGRSSSISRFLLHLVSSVTPRSAGISELLYVLAVHRYLGEPASESGGELPPSYLYDVTVTDGSCRVKGHLSPGLNPLVQQNRLRVGCRVRLTRCSLVYDEKRLGHCFLQIEELELEPGGGEHAGQVDLGALSAASLRDLTTSQRGRDLITTLQSKAPLRGGRTHYLPLWNNTDPCGAEWNANQLPASEVPFHGCRFISLQHLARTWRTRFEFPHLLVRVMYKSRLRYYGRPGTKVDFPYQAYLEVADQSGMMPVVLWNSLCREWYQSLHVGTVLLLHRYSVKQSYQRRTWAMPSDLQMRSYRSVEICLNPREPHTEIQIVPTKQVKAEWRLPDIKYNFVTRVELDKLPDAYTCDVIGVVTFVGRCQRRRKEEGSEDFYLYRWVHAVDGSTQQPFILEIFATSQPETFQQVHPLTYLVCTQMRVVREFTVPYLTTSNESQISITGHHKGQPYTQDPKVQHFIQWVKGQQEKDLLRRSVIGGHYSFPPAPRLFQDYCKNLNAEVVLTSTSDLMKVITGLHYREHRRITLQAIIAAVRFIRHAASGNGTDHVQNTANNAGLSLKEGNAFPQSSLEPVQLMDHLEKRLNQPAKRLQTVQAQGRQKCRSLVLNNYVLRHRYNLRDLQKTDRNKGRASRVKLLNAPTILRKRNKASKTKAQLLKRRKPMCHGENIQPPYRECRNSTLILRRASDQDAGDSVNGKGPSQGAEEPVAVNRDKNERTTETHTDCCPQYAWQSAMWPEIRGHLSAHLHFGQLLPESIPRKFDYRHRDFLKQQYNLQAAEYEPATDNTRMDLQRFGPACNHGYYCVTLVGINHQVAADVVFLPALKSHEGLCTSCLPMESHDNSFASILASGYVCDQEPTNNNQTGQVSASPDHIVRTAAELDNLHIICVLDLCHHGADKSEVILNKIYQMSD
ncbi:RPA-related protein RADX isoform X2 [Mobula birostris]|uniref:RPA-related protein RADX isoform X2 n=1 Tax=Mobula birostris TaxID=1983395 RepID=UPI003B27CCE3